MSHDTTVALDVPAYLANGVIGLRPALSLPLSGHATANGHVGVRVGTLPQSSVYVPYPIAFDIAVGDRWLSAQPTRAQIVAQDLDPASGELRTSLLARWDEVTVSVELVAFCSRTLPTIAVLIANISVDRPAALGVRFGIDASSAVGECLHRDDGRYDGTQVVDGCVLWRAPGGLSRVGVAYRSQVAAEADRTVGSDGASAGGWRTTWRWRAQSGRIYAADQIASVVASALHGEPDRQAVRMAFLAAERGSKRLRDENRASWNELRRGRPILHGAATRWQRLADACFLQLHSAAHQASPCGTTLFGLGHWPGYHCFHGHGFWDVETFALPPLALTAPHAARALLEHRFRHRDAAARNAAMNGYRGLQFPWESAALTGEEVTPSAWPMIIFEQHVTLDVAFAFAQFAHLSGDRAFLRERAWPILRGVAEWIVSRVEFEADGWHIKQSMGICEGVVTDDNAFVMCAAHVVLGEAVAAARALGESVPALWEEVRSGLAVPRRGDLILRARGLDAEVEDDAAETIAALYPYTYDPPPAVAATTLRHHLVAGRRALGMPMLPPLLAVAAARLGDRDAALELLERGVADYAIEPFLLMDEFGCTRTTAKPRVGPYLAHAGAFIMNCLIGLPGLRFDGGAPSAWSRFPVTLPRGWDAITAERVWIHDQPMRLMAEHGAAHARLEI